jgi:glutaconate CoA-transferase subunit B
VEADRSDEQIRLAEVMASLSLATDLGVLAPDPETCELTLTHLHPGGSVEQVRAATGWRLALADPVAVTDPPTAPELAVLRALKEGTPV